MRIRTIPFHLIIFLLLSSLTLPAIACPPPDCGSCCHWVSTGPGPSDGYCELDAECGDCRGCYNPCYSCVSCYCERDCSPTQSCCTDSGDYCCESNETCCEGNCCATGQCCNDGTCVDTCPDCYECVDGSCEPCKCWDDGDPISGSITVQDAKLCEEVTHTSSISDTDHWVKGGGGEGNPTDTISSYSWDQAAGTNPETGTFTEPTDEATVEWRAPPCTGTVTIKLDADDEPDSMDNPCPDSDRDDPNKVFEGTSTVSLPDGCDDCSGDPEISLEIIPEPSTNPSDCTDGGCGYADKPTNLDIIIATPCYDSCTWRFGVTATADVYYGPCIDNYIPIESGDASALTEENYCEIADGFDYTPSDESTGTGCAEVGDTQYSSTLCLWDHELAHVVDFQIALQDEEELLVTNPCLADMTIDCSDPDTKTCSDAKAAREAAIITAVKDAYDYCYICNDESAREAAYDCFHERAGEICSYAVGQGWETCDYCH